MYRFFLLVFFSPLVLANNIYCPDDDNAAIVGVAMQTEAVIADVANGFLYCEYHILYDAENNKLTTVQSMDNVMDSVAVANVEYRDSDQTLIARKVAQFVGNARAPDVEQIDFRTGEKITIKRHSIGSANNDVSVVYLASENSSPQKERFSLSDTMVIDAGFDNTIRTYWDDILAEKKVIFEFLVPASLTTVDLSVIKQSMVQCQYLSDEIYREDDHLCVQVKAANIVLAWFVKPLTLVYQKSTKRLLVFSGRVNITDANGVGQQATIHYRYRHQ